MKNIFRTAVTALISCMMAFAGASCDDDDENALELSADKSSIAADGTESVTFTVKDADGKNQTAKSGIMNLTGSVELAGNKFSSTQAGVYKFQAVYEGRASNEVEVTVTPLAVSEVVLTADKTELSANSADKVIFTVVADGQDVTTQKGASVCYEFGDSGMCLPISDGKIVFVTDTPGEYLFTASYEGVDSDPITITAVGK